MYEAFYGLTEKPFSIQPDPDFLYFGQRHSLAYSMLEYGITTVSYTHLDVYKRQVVLKHIPAGKSAVGIPAKVIDES